MRLVPTYVRAYAHSIMHATSRARWKWFPEIALRPASSDPNLAISHQINDVISLSKLIVNLWPFRTISEFKNLRREARRCENVVARTVPSSRGNQTSCHTIGNYQRISPVIPPFHHFYFSFRFALVCNCSEFARLSTRACCSHDIMIIAINSIRMTVKYVL